MLKILKRLRNYLISGLLFWIPLILTIVVIKFFLEFINNLVPKEYLPEDIFNIHLMLMLSLTLVIFFMTFRKNNVISRAEGFLLLLTFLTYIGYIILNN